MLFGSCRAWQKNIKKKRFFLAIGRPALEGAENAVIRSKPFPGRSQARFYWIPRHRINPCTLLRQHRNCQHSRQNRGLLNCRAKKRQNNRPQAGWRSLLRKSRSGFRKYPLHSRFRLKNIQKSRSLYLEAGMKLHRRLLN